MWQMEIELKFRESMFRAKRLQRISSKWPAERGVNRGDDSINNLDSFRSAVGVLEASLYLFRNIVIEISLRSANTSTLISGMM